MDNDVCFRNQDITYYPKNYEYWFKFLPRYRLLGNIFEIQCTVVNTVRLGNITAHYTILLQHYYFRALTLLGGRQEGHPASKKLGVGLLAVKI